MSRGMSGSPYLCRIRKQAPQSAETEITNERTTRLATACIQIAQQHSYASNRYCSHENVFGDPPFRSRGVEDPVKSYLSSSLVTT